MILVVLFKQMLTSNWEISILRNICNNLITSKLLSPLIIIRFHPEYKSQPDQFHPSKSKEGLEGW